MPVRPGAGRWAALLVLLLVTAQAAEQADALPTLFDFLGAMVEQEGEWVDPLDMEQQLMELELADPDGQAPASDTAVLPVNEPTGQPVEEQP